MATGQQSACLRFQFFLASCNALHTAAPEEIPTKMPSFSAIARAVSNAASLGTLTIAVVNSRIQNARDKACAQTLNRMRPFSPPLNTGEASGSTATI